MARDPLDERNFYQHWRGRRTRMADVITAAEVDLLEATAAPFSAGEYVGPILGTWHVYWPAPLFYEGMHMSEVERLRQEQIERDREARERHEARLQREGALAYATFKMRLVCPYWYCRHEADVARNQRKGYRCKMCGTSVWVQ